MVVFQVASFHFVSIISFVVGVIYEEFAAAVVMCPVARLVIRDMGTGSELSKVFTDYSATVYCVVRQLCYAMFSADFAVELTHSGTCGMPHRVVFAA